MTVQDKSVAELAKDAMSDVSSIAQKEAQLARIEIKENIDTAMHGLSGMVSSVAILIPAITLVLMAIAFGIANIDGMATWASFAIVGVISGIVGYIALKSGRSAISPDALAPSKTAKNLRRDAQTLKEAL